MTFTLSSQNVFEYLEKHRLYNQQAKHLSKVELKAAKNFNLLVDLSGDRQLLVKQERYNLDGKTSGEFANEWRVQELFRHFTELNCIQPYLPEILHFNASDSIIILNYLSDYRDLADFYTKENNFSTEIASSIGAILAAIHRITFDRHDYRDFLCQSREIPATDQAPSFIQGLDRISPEVFGSVPVDGMKFFALYQRYDSLGKAIAELTSSFTACCLVHNDLKLNNVLLYFDWKNALIETHLSSQSSVRFIDWERSTWGDPAFDLGTLIASYLQFWLGSLVVSKTISIEDSLRMALMPLELLQPSIAAFMDAYLNHFPTIMTYRPDFLLRVMQFAGLALIQQIQTTIQYQKAFGNAGICTLQVAKSLLCRPAQSISTIFGWSESELAERSYLSV
ncbi:aminoglycoside phosphotransferase family protein [Phormidium tenue FACHB-886]|nr:aminoglycoside phosphotransferase family protein [Phormidium tenue FACHB-886]